MNAFPVPIPDVWERLFAKALLAIGEIEQHGRADPFWTFGGGTVLMLRYGHRFSKDIDIFVPDPQSLGYVTPRLSEVAETITGDYVESATYVKLFLEEGEIDFVAAPNLTSPAFDLWTIQGRTVRVETAAEIIAKKMWHRGDRITGRDIFDFALIAEREPESLFANAGIVLRHADAVIAQLSERRDALGKQFAAIDRLNFDPEFVYACDVMVDMLERMRVA